MAEERPFRLIRRSTGRPAGEDVQLSHDDQLGLAEQFGVERALAALDSPEVVAVLQQHGRKSIQYCYCGWGELGRSHAAHVLSEIVVSVRGRL